MNYELLTYTVSEGNIVTSDLSCNEAFHEFLSIIFGRLRFLEQNGLLRKGLIFDDINICGLRGSGNRKISRCTFHFIGDSIVCKTVTSENPIILSTLVSDNNVISLWNAISDIITTIPTKNQPPQKAKINNPKQTFSDILNNVDKLTQINSCVPNNETIIGKTQMIIETSHENENTQEVINVSNTNENEITSEEAQMIEEKIKMLEEAKHKLMENVKEIQQTISQDADNLANFECNLRYEKMLERQEKEKEEEAVRIFESDISVYGKLKTRFDEDKDFTESYIPALFKAKYPVMKFMDKENLLSDEDNYNIFCELYNACFPPDDEYKVSDKYVTLVNKFLESISFEDTNVMTKEEIMETLNSMDHKHKNMFTEDIPLISDDENDDIDCNIDTDDERYNDNTEPTYRVA